MAATSSIFDFLYRVVGASRVTSSNRQVAAGMRAVTSAARNARAGILGMSTALTGGFISFAALGLALRRVIHDYSAYTIATARVNTTLTSMVRNVGNASRMVRDVSDSAAISSGYSLTQGVEGMNVMLETGLGVHESMRVYSTATQLARVGNMSLERSTQFLTDTMNQFQREAAGNNEELQHFARRMSSQLVVGANMASTSIEQLQVAFRYAGAEMSTLGFSSQETMAALAGLSSMGLRAGNAGTALRRTMAALVRITPQTYREFQQMGVDEQQLNSIMHDSAGNLRPLEDGMTRLRDVFAGLNEQQRAEMGFRLFGIRGMGSGQTLADLTEGSERIHDIMREYQTAAVAEGTVFDEQHAQRMRAFGVQVEQFKLGLSDLAIAFGEILFETTNTERGMGTMLREMVAGIRIAGNLNDMTDDQRRQWEALSEAERQQAIQYRQLLQDIVSIIRGLGAIAGAITPIVTQYPGLIAGLLLLRAITGVGLVSALGRFGGMLATTSGWLVTNAASATGATLRMRLLRGAIMGLAVHMAGMATRALQDFTIHAAGMDAEMRQIRGGINEANLAMANQLPIIGNLLGQWIELYGAIAETVRQYAAIDARRQTERERTISISAEDRMNAIMADRRRAAGGTITNEADVRTNETNREANRSMMRTAALLFAQGERSYDDILTRMRQEGMGADTAQRVYDYQQRNASMMQQEADSLVEGSSMFGINTRDFSTAAADSVRQLSQFEAIVTRTGESLEAMISSGGPSAPSDMSIPTVQDAYIRRTGVIRASAGDVLVNRSSLASAISSSSGSLAGPLTGGSSNMVGGPSSGGGGSGGTTVIPTVVLQLDGREIARAVGSAHATHLERSGVPIQPGQRRTMRETGFQERLG